MGREGSSIRAMAASMASPGLWGGMLVARPTAMPEAPLISRLGNRPGSSSGSLRVSSKFSVQSTVSRSISRSSSMAAPVIRASVYRMAAAESPSMEPKFPWPSTKGRLMLKGCARCTMASYTEESPWGWYLPRQSPTIRALLRWGLSGDRPSSSMVYRIRR